MGPTQRRLPHRSRKNFRLLALTLALPFLVCVLYFAWRFAAGLPLLSRASVTAASLADLVEKEAIDAPAIRREGRVLHIETAEDPEVLARRITRRIRGSRFTRSGASVLITRESDATKIEITRFRGEDSGAGLVGVDDGRPKAGSIVLILDDIGFERQPLAEVVELDPNLNFAVLPNATETATAVAFLHSRGVELLCHLPMEPEEYPRISPGPDSILTAMTDERIREVTRRSLRAVPGARGVNNHMGSLATADARVMRDVLEALPEGLYFIDSRTTPRSVAEHTAELMGRPTASRDVFLDPERTEVAIRKQIDRLAGIASSRGHAIAIGHLYPETVSVLREEIPRLRKKGFRFVRASEVVN